MTLPYTHLKLVQLKTKEQLEVYEQAWNEILTSCENNNPFIEFNWVITWIDSFDSDHQIEILVVEEEGAAIAFFPCCRKKIFGIHEYQFLAYGHANYMDLIVSPQMKREVIHFILDSLMQKYKHVIFRLHGLLETSTTANLLESYMYQKSLPFSIHRVVVPYINLDEVDFLQFMKKRKKLHGMDRREKRLQQLGEVKFTTLDASRISEVFAVFEKRWAQKMDTSGFSKGKNRRFFRALAHIHEGNFRTKIDAILLDDHLIGYIYGFVCRGRYVVYAIGHDTDFDLFGPGQMMMKEKIKQSVQQQKEIFDMSIGYETYKFIWNTDVDFSRKMIFSTNTFRARCLRQMYALKEYGVSAMKKNHRIVKWKRNSLGKIKHLFSHGFSREMFGNLKEKVIRKIHYLQYDVYKKKNYVPYPILYNSKFQEITVQQVFEKVPNHRKEWIQFFYQGYKQFVHNGEIGKGKSFRLNPRFLRIQSIDYMKELPEGTYFLDGWEQENLEEICVFVQKRLAGTLVTYIRPSDKEKQEALQKAGFILEKKIISWRIPFLSKRKELDHSKY